MGVTIRPIKISRGATPTIAAKQLRAYQKAAIPKALLVWFDKFLKLHFRPEAFSRYGYQTRSKKYRADKRRLVGFDRPIYWTGDTERQMKGPAQLSGTSTNARLRMQAPWYVVAASRRDSAKAPDMEKELTTIIPEEEEIMAEAVENELAAQMNAEAETETRRLEQ